MLITDLRQEHLPSFLDTLEELTDVRLTKHEAAKVLLTLRKNKTHRVLVALRGGAVVGTASLLVEQKFIHGGCRVGHIEDVAVDMKAQRAGVGTKLVRRAVSVARRAGCYRCVLDCSDSVAPFYERMGFKRHGLEMRLELR